jgi:hypothetical protein
LVDDFHVHIASVGEREEVVLRALGSVCVVLEQVLVLDS